MPVPRPLRTSESQPLRIDTVQARPGWGLIGMSLCPGKQQVDGLGGLWQWFISVNNEKIKTKKTKKKE